LGKRGNLTPLNLEVTRSYQGYPKKKKKMELRDYQNEAIEDLRKSFSEKNDRVILCLPTGSGKTVIFSEMVRLAYDRKTTTLVLTDRLELFKQTLSALARHGMDIQELSAKKKKGDFDPNCILTLAMIETLKRRKLENYNPKLIIIDEAHKGNFTKIFTMFPNARIIGATATPVGKHIFKNYQDIIQSIDIPELIDKSFLSPCKAFQMVDDFSDLETRRGEYTEESLFNHFDKRKLYSGVVNNWREKAEGKKTIIFNVNIEHTIEMTKEFNNSGIVSECLTSKTSKPDRDRILRAFSDGLFPVLNNCGILTTGYDEPSIECVVMNRKTKSLPLWLQCCGRGSRIYPGKENFIILDFGMNHDMHGLWEEPRKWTLKPPKKKKKDQVAPVKECPQCLAMLPASIMECKFCGHIFTPKSDKLAEGVMVEVKKAAPSKLIGRKLETLSVDELIELQISKRYKPSFIWRVIRSHGKDALEEYASKMEYKSGWVYHHKGKMNDCEFTNFIIK